MRTSLLLAAAVLLAVQAVRAAEFLAGLEDVPVMPGLAVVRDAGTAFDTPAGRIVQAYAAGRVTRESVHKFYQTALPQLGWARTGPLVFRREGERLTIEVIGGTPATVRFEVGPAVN